MSVQLTEQAVTKRFRLDELLPDAQNRRLRDWKVDQIAKHFDFGRWTPPVVRESGNCVGPTLVEGHHRVAAACKRGLGHLEVICYAHPPIDVDSRVGDMYIGINNQLASTSTEKFLMRLRAEDATATAVAALIRTAGFDEITDAPGDNQMHVPVACEWVYQGGSFRRKLRGKPTPESLVFALSAMRSIYGTDRDAIRPEIIRGFGSFAHRWTAVELKTFNRKVAAKHPRVNDLLKDSKVMMEAQRCSAHQAMAMVVRLDFNYQAKKPLEAW
jgi:hypothetical protein